jgi:hypothetical protein
MSKAFYLIIKKSSQSLQRNYTTMSMSRVGTGRLSRDHKSSSAAAVKSKKRTPRAKQSGNGNEPDVRASVPSSRARPGKKVGRSAKVLSDEDKEHRKRIQRAFVHNLKLLGYDPESKNGTAQRGKSILPGSTLSRVHGYSQSGSNRAAETRQRRRTEMFGVDMFVRPNANGFYHILYFLLSCLRKKHVAKVFEKCWPLHDNIQVREFRRVALGELKQLVDVGAIPSTLAQPSLLTTPLGVRAEKLAWLLSTYTLEKVFSREHPKEFASLNLPKARDAKDFESDERYKEHIRELSHITKAHKAYHAKLFRKQAKSIAKTQNEWENYSVKLTNAYRALMSHKVILEERADDYPNVDDDGSLTTETYDNMILLHGGLPNEVKDVLKDSFFYKIQLDDSLKRTPLNGQDIMPTKRSYARRQPIEEMGSIDFADVLKQVSEYAKELREEYCGHQIESNDPAKVYEAIPLLGGEQLARELEGLRSSVGTEWSTAKVKQAAKGTDRVLSPQFKRREAPAPASEERSHVVAKEMQSSDAVTPSTAFGGASSESQNADRKTVVESVNLDSIKIQLENLRFKQNDSAENNAGSSREDSEISRYKAIEQTLLSLRNRKVPMPPLAADTVGKDERVVGEGEGSRGDSDEDFFSSALGIPVATGGNESASKANSSPARKIQADLSSALSKLEEKTSVAKKGAEKEKINPLERKRLLVKLLTPMSKRAPPPSPLRTELIKLISALHRHGSIDEDSRGNLKDKVITSKSLAELQSIHKEISEMFGDSVVPQ